MTPRPAGLAGVLTLTLLIQVLVTAALIAPSVAAPVLLREMGLPPSTLGLYLSLAYAGAMIGSGMGGAVAPRLGALRLSQVGLLGCAVGLGLLCLAHPLAGAIGALLIGLSYGPVTPASSQILAHAAPPRRMALVFSIKQTGVPLGGVVAGMVVPPTILHQGWRAALGLMALGCVACAVAAQPWRRSLDVQRANASPVNPLKGLAQAFRLVRGSAPLRALTWCAVIFSIAQVGLTSYLVTFLTVELSWTLVAAGVALSMSQSFGALGRIVWGQVADKWLGASRTLGALCLGMVCCAAAMTLLGPSTPAWLVLVLVSVFGGLAIGWNGVYLSGLARHAPPGMAGVATGGSLMFTYLGVVLGPPSLAAVAGAAGHWGWVFGCTAVVLLLCLRFTRQVDGKTAAR